MGFKRHTITAALPYANGPVHIGHLAGCYLPADIYVRYLRLKGEDVKFICGSDEHGVPITIKAKNEGITPQQVVDKYHKMMKDSFAEFGISFDIYSRTSSKIHHETASEFFKTLYDKNIFTEEITEQYFDEKANQFLADRYIVGTCPKCQNENAYGDQCEKCGSTLSPTDLINPKSTLSGEKPVLRKTKNWFLPLDKMQPQIEKYIESHKDWKVNVYGQCKSWIDQKLQPRAMTRDLDWGVKVPIKDAEGKVLYVWFDAPIGYISATKELLSPSPTLPKGKGALSPSGRGGEELWELYWKDKETRLVHFIGKDNIVFHCIIFPAMLMAHGDYILADNVPANEFLNLEGDKISTSRNWAVWLHEYLIDFPNKQDVLRYTLTANAPETKDNDFTWKDFQQKNNSELVAILGNFVNRTVVLTQKYFAGKVPPAEEFTKTDVLLMEEICRFPQKISASLDAFRFREALAEMMNLARIGNKYLAENEPWKLSDQKRVETILNICLQVCANIAVLAEPFLPNMCINLSSILGIGKLNWRDGGRTDILKTGHPLGTAKLLFEKIEDEAIDKQMEKLKKSPSPPLPSGGGKEKQKILPNGKNLGGAVTIDDFKKLDIRVGRIIEALDFPEAKKPAYKLKIDFGKEIGIKNSSAGITKNYAKEQLKGKLILAVVNFPPRKVGPFISEVLTLGVPDKNNESILVEPGKDVEVGGKLS
ncbi:MAG: methionine--tRNA ligase [Bacteroidetes bacterium]|nr:methionine--tRNA ligase [Bacteroidota bacterium]